MKEEPLFSWHHQNLLDKSDFIKFAILEFPLTKFHEWRSIFAKRWYSLFLRDEKNNRWYSTISNYSEGWKDVHETAGNGLIVCFKEKTVRNFEELHLPSVMDVLPVSMEIWSKGILFFLFTTKIHRKHDKSFYEYLARWRDNSV